MKNRLIVSKTRHGLRLLCCIAGLTLFFATPLRAQRSGPAFEQPAMTASEGLPAAQIGSTSGMKYQLEDRFRDYTLSTYQPMTFLAVATSAAYDQMTNYPPEWRQGWKGYGKRALSGYGISLVSNTISFGLAALDREDARYEPCDCRKTAIFTRLGHALKLTLTSRLDGGGRTLAFSRFAGAYGSGFVANSWYPAAHSNYHNAVRIGTSTMVTAFGMNLLREFIRPHIVRR